MFARDVLKLYDFRSRQLDAVFESPEYKNTPNKDLTNIFFFLHERRFMDTCTRYLLYTCLNEVTWPSAFAKQKENWS